MKYNIVAYSDMDKTNIEYTVFFDSVLNATESYSNQVTSHAVEDGGVINDHIIKNKDKINIEGIVTDLSFNQGDTGLVMFSADGEIGLTVTENWSKKVKKSLLDINERSLPCSIKVTDKINGYEYIESDTFPCFIESLNLDNSGGQYGFIQPKLTLVPVRIASIEFVKLTAQQEAIPALKRQQQGSTNANVKTAGKSDDKDEVEKLVDLDLKKTQEEAKEANKGLLDKASEGIKKYNSSLESGIGEKIKRTAEINREIAEMKKK